jgi:peptidoglycan hydrolase-like protein with peptidoglycan-binding domain
MASIDESGLVGKTRDQPISPKLRQVLLAAGDDADIDVISIASGGQPTSGPHRVGSHRHDNGNAADLDLIKNGRTLKFTNTGDLETFKRFVTSAAAHGANGIGAAEGYMGASRIHVGFGNGPNDITQVVWGAGNTSANAPPWLRPAEQRGWADRLPLGAHIPDDEPDVPHVFGGKTMTDDGEVERFRPLLDFIAKNEVGTTGTEGYNTSLHNGAHLPGGREQTLITKTLDEIDRLQTFMLRSSKSSAIGRYQIVRTTLRGLRQKLRLSGSELYSQTMQDRLGATLINGRGRDAEGLRNEWESLKKFSDQTILAKYDEKGSGGVGRMDDEEATPSSVADLVKILLGRLQPGAKTDQLDGDWPVLKQGTSNQKDAVQRLQTTLNDLRYYTGGADGIYGPMTTDAVALFQFHNALPVTGQADATTMMALTNGSARALTEDRVAMDVPKLREMGSQTIRNADFSQMAGGLAGILGLGGVGKSSLCAADPTISTICSAATGTNGQLSLSSILTAMQQIQTKLSGAASDQAAQPLIQGLDAARTSLDSAIHTLGPVAVQAVDQANSSGLTSLLLTGLSSALPGGWVGSLITLGLGGAVTLFGNRVKQRRLADQREGKNIGDRTT